MTGTRRARMTRGWGTVLAGISITGTIIAAMAGFVFAMAMSAFNDALGGGTGTMWIYWLVALAFALVGLAGLVLTSRIPSLAYLLRATALVPALFVGLVSPWVLALPALVLAADVSLLLTHIRWIPNGVVRWAAAALLGAGFAVVTLPVVTVGCRPRRGGNCEYNSLVGWGYYEEQQLLLWSGLVVLVVVIVGLPVVRDEQDALV